MYLKRINVRNYSSFKETGQIDFAPGINIVVGQNNSGKSALLRVFDREIADDRHRNHEEWREERLERPEIHLDIETSGEEIKGSILRRGGQFHWPFLPPNDQPFEEFSSFLSQPSHAFPSVVIPAGGCSRDVSRYTESFMNRRSRCIQ
jgi:hypothetical protein